MTDPVLIPLRNRDGIVVAEALVDVEDEELSSLRWYRLAAGYVVRTEITDGRKRMVYLHRLIISPPAQLLVDHINSDRLDNRRANLRVADYSGNGQNRGANHGRALPRGVHASRRQFLALAKLNGVRHEVGRFPTAELAEAAICAWRAEHMPYSADARRAR